MFLNGELIARDVSEAQLLKILRHYKLPAKIVLSPLDRQGFILGRGNRQISPEIIKLIGPSNLIIIA